MDHRVIALRNMMRMYRFLNLILVNKFLDYLVSKAAVACGPPVHSAAHHVSSSFDLTSSSLLPTDHRILHAIHQNVAAGDPRLQEAKNRSQWLLLTQQFEVHHVKL